jgi:hypothetical protein
VRSLAAATMIASLVAGPCAAQGLDQAQSFVAGLYGAYAKRPGPDYLGPQKGRVFSPSLIGLMRRDAAATPKGEVGALDGDPICNCQDYELSRISIKVDPTSAGAARATVSFQNFDRPQEVVLDLVATKGQWRVDDVHAEGTPSLRGLLTASLAARTR